MANVFEGQDEDTGAVTPAAQAASAANSATGGASFASGAGAGSAWRGSRSQGFGPTSEVRDGGYTYRGVYYPHFNKGTDFAAAAGSTIESPVAGVVIQAGHANDGWDNSVKIRDAQGNTHNFGHMDPTMNVKVGQSVTPGMLLGRVGGGTSEHSSGPHLSYDVWNSSGEFFDAVSEGGGEMSTSGGSGGSGGGSSGYGDPAMDEEYRYLQSQFLEASQAWRKAGRPTSGPAYEEYWNAQGELEAFTALNGHPKSTANDIDPAQQEFENRIALGDFELRQADSAFARWFDKYSTAQKEATSTSEQRAQHNVDNANMVEARNKSQTPGLLPRATDAGYVETNREALLDQYLKKLGIGHDAPEFTPGTTGVTMPVRAPDAGTGPPKVPGILDQPGLSTKTGGERVGSRALFDEGLGIVPSEDNTTKPWKWPGFENVNSTWKPFGLNDAPATPWKPPGQQQSGQGWQPFGMGNQEVKPNAQRYDILDPIKSVGSAIKNSVSTKDVKKATKKWWKRGFAEGGVNIPAQRAWTGERGPEIMELPGFGSKMVGMNGPEETDIPEGANIIPVDEAYAMRQIQQAARQGNQPDMQRQAMETQERMRDPMLQQKVMEAVKKALASDWASNPPFSPMLEDPARMKDYWGPQRMVSGNPISQEEAAMAQQAAAKKPAAPAPAAPQGVV